MTRVPLVRTRDVELLDGCRVRFRKPCGCSETIDYARKPVAKRLGREALRLLVHWWTVGGGVAVPVCRRHPEFGPLPKRKSPGDENSP